ncbi:MAG: 2Fe-2S iron-sulfur cluster binding domain-containing protein [Phycisphaerales bacterium]|nr:2Fe-2S iron-sulfur cluster binding domain-containing protein [Phycisphaerales bacterium]
MNDQAPQPSAGRNGTLAIRFTLNGREVAIAVDPTERLLDTLRYRLNLPGSKEGCGEGECGACTVIIDDLPANSCLVPTFQVRGCNVRTIESIPPSSLQPMLESGATQCGACTPGVVVTANWIKEHSGVLASHTMRALMAGNLCRCTGYDGIIDGLENWIGTPRGGRP